MDYVVVRQAVHLPSALLPLFKKKLIMPQMKFYSADFIFLDENGLSYKVHFTMNEQRSGHRFNVFVYKEGLLTANWNTSKAPTRSAAESAINRTFTNLQIS
jgi:hypothetical protein